MEIRLTFSNKTRKLPVINALKNIVISPDKIIKSLLKKELPFDEIVFIHEDDYYKVDNLFSILEKYGVIIKDAFIEMPPLSEVTIQSNVNYYLENIDNYYLEKIPDSDLGYIIFTNQRGFILIEDDRLHRIIVEALLNANVTIR